MKRRNQSALAESSTHSAPELCAELRALIWRARNIRTERILRIDALRDKSGRARSTIWRDIKAGTLPPQIKIGERSVGWKESEIDACLAARIFASRTGISVDMKAFVQQLISRQDKVSGTNVLKGSKDGSMQSEIADICIGGRHELL